MTEAQKEKRAQFKRELRARISLIAAERGMPPAETAKLMSYLYTRDVIAFIKRHNISADWLLCGDLKGLLRMARNPAPRLAPIVGGDAA
jgi:hypothetical protein